MKGLIKAQIYQLLRTRVYYMVMLFFLAMGILFGSVEYMNGPDELEEWQQLTASDFATRMQMIPTLSVMGMAFFAAFMCADDFNDKTLDHELLSGRRRTQVYFSRAIISVTVCVIFSLLMFAVSLVSCTLLEGWGDSIPVSAAVTRILLTVFPMFRISCFFCMIAYFIKRPGIVFLTIYGLINAIGLLNINSDHTYVLTGLNTATQLLHYDEWHVFGLESGVNMIYLTQLDPAFLVRSIIVSLAAGAVYLMIGYCYFRRDDLA